MKVYVAVLLLASAAAVVYLQGSGRQTKELMQAAIAYIEAQGDNAMAAYLLFTFVGVIALVPTTLMEFAGGFIFVSRYGLTATWLLTSFVKLLANVVAVWMAKHVLRDWVRATFVEKSELLTMVSEAVRHEPFKMAFLVRGSMVPLSVKNYGLGVLDIGYVPIAMASCVFTPFYAYQNLYMGSACQDLADIFSGKAAKSEDSWASQVKKVFPIACNVVLLLFFMRVVKAQLQKSRASAEASLRERATDPSQTAPPADGARAKKEE